MNGELPSDLHWLSASEAATAIARRQISPVELTQALLARIDRLEPRLNAFITVDGDAALAAARAAEAEIHATARKQGMVLMREDGERLVQAGITSAEELLRVTRD